MAGNKNYKRGRAKEYRVMKEYREGGYVCARTAGSHGIFDLVSIDREKKRIIFTQCKPSSMGKRARANLEKKHEWLNDTFSVFFCVR